MRNFFLLISMLVLCGKPLCAQSLSFSQVLLIKNVEDTVPAGKVWKVESFISDGYIQNTSASGCGFGIDARQILLNGATRYIQSEGLTTGGNAWMSGSTFPLWLPAGTRIRTYCANTELSIIEFNVIP